MSKDSDTRTIGTAILVSIGDELSRGEVVDTNAAWLGALLDSVGIHVRGRFGVNDVAEEILEALRSAATRADVVIVCGGLGPTSDDLTVDAAATLVGVEPVIDATHEDRLRAWFAQRGRTVSALALRQVRVPDGAQVFPNPVGLAPGFSVRHEAADLYFLPGVPREMRAIFESSILPSLRARSMAASSNTADPDVSPQQPVRHKTILRIFGKSEGLTDEALRGILRADLDGKPPEDAGVHTTLHYRLAYPEILVTFITTGPKRLADARQAGLLAEARKRLTTAIYSEGEKQLPEVVTDALRQRQQTVSTAESCTGGLIGTLLTALPDSSRTFAGGIICYTEQAKTKLLGVPTDLLATETVYSLACVEQMARGARAQLGTDYAVAVSGIAGPSGATEKDPVGTVYVAVHSEQQTKSLRVLGWGDRDELRRFAAWSALYLLWRMLREAPAVPAPSTPAS